MRRIGVAMVAAVAMAQTFDTSRWEFRARVAAVEGEIAAFPIDREAMIRGFESLRLVRENREVPYTIERLGARSAPYELSPRVIDEAFTPAGDLVLMLDFGERTRPHDRVEFTVTPDDFRFGVTIETSDDRVRWLIARRGAWIVGFAQDGSHVSVRSVPYPPSSKRYLRATVAGVKVPKIVTALRSLRYEEKPAELEPVGVIEPARSTEAKTRTTTLEFDLGADGALHDRVTLEAGPGEFYRAATIDTSVDGKVWRYLASGSIARVGGHDDLRLTFAETGDRYLRVRIYNGDDPPVAVLRGTFETVRRIVLFPAGAGDTWVYGGHAMARAPEYDFARLRGGRVAVRTSAGPWEKNPAYVPPPKPVPPVTDRYSWLLYGVLGVAVIAMGAAAVRLLKKAAV